VLVGSVQRGKSFTKGPLVLNGKRDPARKNADLETLSEKYSASSAARSRKNSCSCLVGQGSNSGGGKAQKKPKKAEKD